MKVLLLLGEISLKFSGLSCFFDRERERGTIAAARMALPQEVRSGPILDFSFLDFRLSRDEFDPVGDAHGSRHILDVVYFGSAGCFPLADCFQAPGGTIPA